MAQFFAAICLFYIGVIVIVFLVGGLYLTSEFIIRFVLQRLTRKDTRNV